MVFDSEVQSRCAINNNEFILTDEQSKKIFNMPTGTTTKASVKSKMYHNHRDTSRKVNMLPALKQNHLGVREILRTQTTSQY